MKHPIVKMNDRSKGLPELRLAKATEIHLRNMEKLFMLLPHLGQESRQAYAAKYIGTDVVPMPKLTLSAAEVGEALDLSAYKVERLTYEHDLKIPQYGCWVLKKSARSTKQVETFRYYNNIIPVLRSLLED